MKPVTYTEHIREATEKMSNGGVFLTSGITKPNTMTMGWGSIAFYWGRPFFVVPVRPSRYTHDLIEEVNEFTVSVPMLGQDFTNQLQQAGKISGRDQDKLIHLGLTTSPSQCVKVPILSQCNLHFECVVRMKQDLQAPLFIDQSIIRSCYPSGDLHTLYYGEIVSCYKTDLTEY